MFKIKRIFSHESGLKQNQQSCLTALVLISFKKLRVISQFYFTHFSNIAVTVSLRVFWF